MEAFVYSTDGLAEPLVAIVREPCAGAEDEVATARGVPAVARARALPPGRHYVAVSASAPGDFSLVVEARPPVPPLQGDSCAAPASLPTGVRRQVDLLEVADDVTLPCGEAAADAVFAIEVAEPTDLQAARQRAHGAARRHRHAGRGRAGHRSRPHPRRRAEPTALRSQVDATDSVG